MVTFETVKPPFALVMTGDLPFTITGTPPIGSPSISLTNPFIVTVGLTVTVAFAVTVPPEFVAVKVNVVVTVTNTFFEPLSVGVTLPTFGEIVRDVAPVTCQLNNTESPPAATDVGVAVNEPMVGADPPPPVGPSSSLQLMAIKKVRTTAQKKNFCNS